MKIIQISDIHYCDPFLEEVDRCMTSAIDRIRSDNPPALIVLSGDLFDRRLDQNSRAFIQAVRRISELGTLAPVLILQGTFSHDAPGALDVFRHVMSDYPIHVADRIHQVALTRHGFRTSDGAAFPDVSIPLGSDAPNQLLISCLPTINKGAVAAAAGAENVGMEIGEQVAALLSAWAPTHEQARRSGIPSVVVTHGTVSESISEHGVPMAGLDHEYTTGALFASKASAVMVGHIHKFQSWSRAGELHQVIAYPGSIGRLHFGEVDPKGFLQWDVTHLGAEIAFIETPAKRLVEIDFQGTPDMEELKRAAAEARDAHVRVRYTVDEEHRAGIDRAAIEALFEDAAGIKIEGQVAPVQRQRAAGIGRTATVAEKLQQWCGLTESEPGPLLECLAAVEVIDVAGIVEQLP